MSHPFIDTNIIIRLLTGDDPAKQAAAAVLFEDIEAGRTTVYAPDTVIADAVFVLASPRLYHIERSQVTALLTPLVRLLHFRISNRRTLLRALAVYGSKNVDFGDAMIIAAMEQQGSASLYSYDRDFDEIPGITRLEPGAVTGQAA